MRGIERFLAALLLTGAVGGTALVARHSGVAPEPPAAPLAAPPPLHLAVPGAVQAPILVPLRPARRHAVHPPRHRRPVVVSPAPAAPQAAPPATTLPPGRPPAVTPPLTTTPVTTTPVTTTPVTTAPAPTPPAPATTSPVTTAPVTTTPAPVGAAPSSPPAAAASPPPVTVPPVPVPPVEPPPDTRPGYGHGDSNHDHTGPPGLDSGSCHGSHACAPGQSGSH